MHQGTLFKTMTSYLFIKYYNNGPAAIMTNGCFRDLMDNVLTAEMDEDFKDVKTAYDFLKVIDNACMDGDSEAGYMLFEVHNDQQTLIAGS
jgi:hypothetical protein